MSPLLLRIEHERNPEWEIHFRRIDDKTSEKKTENQLDRNVRESHIARLHLKANANKKDDVYEYLRDNVRGQTAYQISAAIFEETKEILKDHKYRRLQRIKLEKSPHSAEAVKDENAREKEIIVILSD